MAKDKTKSVVQKEIDRIQAKGMKVEINQPTPTSITFKFNFEIIKYHRQRVGKFTQYAAPRLQEIVTEAEYRVRGIVMVDPTQDNKPIVSVGTCVPMEMNTNV